ncbi:hypothetical protein EDD30_0279 [Couchioplanes caeruleus]|uniref:Uncharacterized protein n=1 Tax=Couchioplanes caeruleus TaxID=56438 RepID=A0A3N1GBH8_9ACTN|nr:hypothetical protein EDD30_0279 [Couchioplanes caeruleus]
MLRATTRVPLAVAREPAGAVPAGVLLQRRATTEARDERCPAPKSEWSRATTVRIDHYPRPRRGPADLDEKE